MRVGFTIAADALADVKDAAASWLSFLGIQIHALKVLRVRVVVFYSVWCCYVGRNL